MDVEIYYTEYEKMVFITGATGFVGSSIAKELLKKKLKLRCLVRKTSNFRGLLNGDIEVVFGDIGDRILLQRAMKDCSAVIHAAAVLESSDKNRMEEVNVDGTKNTVEAAIVNNIKKFIFISSLDVLLEPRNDYAESKLKAEKIVNDSSISSFFILRPSIIYGGGDNKNISTIIDMVRKFLIVPIIGRGTFRWQPVYVEDLAELIVNIVQNEGSGRNLINFTGPSTISFTEMVDVISEELGVKRHKIYIPLSIMKIARGLFGRTRSGIVFNKILASSRDKLIESIPGNIPFEKGKTKFREGIKKVLLKENE